MTIIQEYSNNPTEDKKLVLTKPIDSYGFTPLAGTDWVEKVVLEYFHLDEDTDIMFEDEYEIYLENKTSNK